MPAVQQESFKITGPESMDRLDVILRHIHLETKSPGVLGPLLAPCRISQKTDQKSELLTCPDYPTMPSSKSQRPLSWASRACHICHCVMMNNDTKIQFRAATTTMTLFSRLKPVCWARTIEMFIHFLISRNPCSGCLAHPCQLFVAFDKPFHTLRSATVD